MHGDNTDPGTVHGIMDCIIVTLVRATYQVKMSNSGELWISPYSSHTGKGSCSLMMRGEWIALYGEYLHKDHSLGHGKIWASHLADPESLDNMLKFLEKYLGPNSTKARDDKV